jgi:hypothetical protein
MRSKAQSSAVGVLVEDVDVAALGRADDGVVVRAEAGPEGLRDHADVREALPYGVGRAVLRRIVEHDDLSADRAAASRGMRATARGCLC